MTSRGVDVVIVLRISVAIVVYVPLYEWK
jgi:hypothetical protein